MIRTLLAAVTLQTVAKRFFAVAFLPLEMVLTKLIIFTLSLGSKSLGLRTRCVVEG